MKNRYSFLSVKGLTQLYLIKTSITHNKYFTPQFSENNDPISAKFAAQMLSLSFAYTLLLLRFLITEWYHS